MAAMQSKPYPKQAAEPAPRYCVDCKFIRSYGAQHYCIGATRNLVTGDPLDTECENMRIPGGRCGPEGKLFVAV
jgi:hypothetical protein